MKVMGIDVGYAITGWSILEKNSNYKNNLNLVDFGAITTTMDQAFSDRLRDLYLGLDKLIKLHNPTHIAIESLFYFKNKKTVINVAQARGVILLVSNLNNLEIFDYTPLQVKTSVTSYGRADKVQVQKMVKLIFGLNESAPKLDDVSDAIAIAYCHINSYVPKR